MIDQLKTILTTHAITHAALARQMGVAPNTVTKFFSRKAPPKLETIQRALDAVNVITGKNYRIEILR